MNNSYEILDVLLQYIQKNGTTEKQCLIDCNINTSFLTDWKGGRLKNPSYDKIVKLAKYLNIDLNLLFLGEENQTNELTADEQELLKNYNKLTGEEKKKVVKDIEKLADGTVQKMNNNRFESVQHINSKENEMMRLFRSLSDDEQMRLIGRAELLAEQANLEENVG